MDRTLDQHGFDLLWIGVHKAIGGVLIWRRHLTWMLFAAKKLKLGTYCTPTRMRNQATNTRTRFLA